MSDIARVLLTAAVLSASALSTFAWRLTRLDPHDPGRVIGELHLAQWAALILAAIGSVPIGLAVARDTVTTGTLDVSIGLAFILFAGYVQRREPRDGLLLVSVGFVVHALSDIAHRPGWLATELTPRWYVVGCAVYDVYLAALCYWARRRG